MKIVTFNIRCDYNQDGINNFIFRKPLILEKIEKEQPDIICFQEVLPQVACWLKDNLTKYYIVGCGREEHLEGEQTSIAYKKDLFSLIGMEVFWLSDTPKVPASRYPDQSDCPRICTKATLLNLQNGEVFKVFNTHLDHVGVEARRLGLIQILTRSQQDDYFTQAPMLLTGDFNALPDSSEMESLQNYPELIDLTTKISGTFHDYGRLNLPEKIDYIIASECFGCRSVSLWENQREGVYLSDHYPVCVEIYTK